MIQEELERQIRELSTKYQEEFQFPGEFYLREFRQGGQRETVIWTETKDESLRFMPVYVADLEKTAGHLECPLKRVLASELSHSCLRYGYWKENRERLLDLEKGTIFPILLQEGFHGKVLEKLTHYPLPDIPSLHLAFGWQPKDDSSGFLPVSEALRQEWGISKEELLSLADGMWKKKVFHAEEIILTETDVPQKQGILFFTGGGADTAALVLFQKKKMDRLRKEFGGDFFLLLKNSREVFCIGMQAERALWEELETGKGPLENWISDEIYKYQEGRLFEADMEEQERIRYGGQPWGNYAVDMGPKRR